MSVRRNSSLITAPVAAVLDAARDGDSFRAAGIRVDRRGPLGTGDITPAGTVRVGPDRVVLSARGLRYELLLIPVCSGTLVVQEVRGRGIAPRQLRRQAEWIRRRVRYEVPVIVAAAVVSGGRLLAAQRSYPAALAGRYELPGGKVEPGESPLGALVREWQEELGVGILPGRRVGGDVVAGRHVLRVWRASIRTGVPEPREHAALCWVGVEGLAGLDWLPADRALLPELRVLLRA